MAIFASRKLFRSLLTCVTVALSATSGWAATNQVVSGHVPPVVAAKSLVSTGQLPGNQQLTLSIELPFRNQAALGQLLQQIYDPASPNFRQYLTPAQFTAQFGPTVADYQAVINFAQANGLTVISQHPNRALLDVVGTVANIQKALNVTMRVYPHPTENRNFYAPSVNPSVALAVPLLQISGLDNYSLPHPNSRSGPAAAAPLATPGGQITPLSGSEGGQYIGSNDFRNAYVPGSTLYGNGQSLALVEFDNYFTNDIITYESLANLPAVTLTNIYLDAIFHAPGGGDGEVSLDIEVALALAPKLSKILVYEGTNGVTTWATMLTQIANDNLAKQISCSWSGGTPTGGEQPFLQMAAQGQSFFNAVGDSDAFTGAIGYPSDSTNVIEVGGTTLYTTGPGGSYVGETVWNWGIEFGDNGEGGSGGVSTSYGIPPWQQGVITGANQGSTTLRNIPDVALTADHVFVTSGNGGSGWFGGTSCAAPLWAAFTALVNQQAATNGTPSVGFLNPALYLIGKSAIYSNCFHDITTGNNEWSGSPTKYSAVPGYDLATGWGSPNGANLINALVSMGSSHPYLISAGSVVSGGSGNGVIDYDDCVLLNLPVANLGGGTAAVVSATLSTSTPGVTITQSNSTYASLAFGTITTNNTAFGISTAPSFICGTPVPLTLVLTYTGGSSTNTIIMPTCQCPAIQVSGSTSASSPTQIGSLFPSGVASSCGAAISCPGTFSAGTVAYNAYPFTNTSSSATCVSVTISTLCGDNGSYGNSIFSGVYLGNYNPANLCAANYLANMGGVASSYSGPGTFFYSFTVPANTNFTVVVNGMSGGAYCSGYNVTVAGLSCPLDGGGACGGLLAVTPTNGLMSVGTQGGPFSPSSQVYTLTNSGSSSLNWQATNATSWVSLSTTSGTLASGGSTTVTVSINANANLLSAGSASDSVVFTNLTNTSGSTARAVSLTINAPGLMAVTPAGGLTSTGPQGGPFAPASQNYTVSNTGGSPISWSAANATAWVSLSATSGLLAPGSNILVTASINANVNSLTVSNYSDAIIFTNLTNASGSTTRAIALTVNAPGLMAVTPVGGLTSTGPQGGPFAPVNQNYTVSNTGGSPISWSATNATAWASLSATSGLLAPGSNTLVTASINTNANSLTVSNYSDAVMFTNLTNTSGSAVRAIALTVLTPAMLVVTPTNGLVSTGPQGGPFSPSSQVYTLTNIGMTSLNWLTPNSSSWVSLSSTSGIGTLAGGSGTTVTVSINTNANSFLVGSDTYNVVFTNLTNISGNTTRAVSLSVNSPGVLAVTPAGGLTSSGTQGGPFSPASQIYTLTNSGGSPISWSATNSTSWLTLSTTSGSLAAGSNTAVTVSINFNANSLAVGNVSDTIVFTNLTTASGSATYPVSLSILTAIQTWQLQYFGCTNCPQAALGGDPLGKGISLSNQFLLGLNPTNEASVFMVTSALPTGGNYLVTWKTAGIRTNVVQATSGGSGAGYNTNFLDISGPIIINILGDTITNYTDVGAATNSPTRFYRIRLGP